jgi:hypothetical protein
MDGQRREGETGGEKERGQSKQILVGILERLRPLQRIIRSWDKVKVKPSLQEVYRVVRRLGTHIF